MKKIAALIPLIFISVIVKAQQLPQTGLSFKMEELTSREFVKAVEISGGVCVIPLGIIEKHGPHLPLGTDLFEAREIAFTAAKKEYAVVFPPYYAGQIFEAKHQPGTIAYSNELIWKMLDETCKELSRNGLKKIVFLNGHGGNTSFLTYFCQSQLADNKDYITVLFSPEPAPEVQSKIKSLKKANIDGHAGEDETSMIYAIDSTLIDQNAMKSESGLDQNRLSKLPYGYTGIWWYAKFPNHFASDVNTPNKELGELLINNDAGQLAELIKYLKKETTIHELQEEFSLKAKNPTLR